jgi:hypothetical protein
LGPSGAVLGQSGLAVRPALTLERSVLFPSLRPAPIDEIAGLF